MSFVDLLKNKLCLARGEDNRTRSFAYMWMIINHSTLDYHVTNFNTLSRWFWRTDQNLTLYSDLYPNINQNPQP